MTKEDWIILRLLMAVAKHPIREPHLHDVISSTVHLIRKYGAKNVMANIDLLKQEFNQ